MSQLRLLSLSHKNTDIKTREMYALTSDEVSQYLRACQLMEEVEELFVLSTCNRIELLYVSETDASDFLLWKLSSLKGTCPKHARTVFQNFSCEESVLKYFFEVAAGLQSQVLGDAQIITQIKSAYRIATAAKMTGTYLHRLMHVIFATNKKITAQTDFRSGISSVPYAAVSLVSDYQTMLKSQKIAVIGFGDMGQLIGKYLLEAGNHTLTAVNRSEEKVIQFNQKFGSKVTFQPMEKLPEILKSHDIIISSVSISKPLIDKSHFEKPSPTDPFKLLVDISMPRSIHSNVDQVLSIIRFDLEHLAEVTQKTLTRKKAAISSVKALLSESLQDFLEWKTNNKNLEVVRSMKVRLETIKKEELDRFKRQYNEDEKKHYELVMDAMIQKIIKKTVVSLKSLPSEQQRHEFSTVITQTFL